MIIWRMVKRTKGYKFRFVFLQFLLSCPTEMFLYRQYVSLPLHTPDGKARWANVGPTKFAVGDMEIPTCGQLT